MDVVAGDLQVQADPDAVAMMLVRSNSGRRRVPVTMAVLGALLGGAAGGLVPPSDAATFIVGSGASKAELRRPGVHVDAWGSVTASASAQRPQSIVLVWTEVSKAAPHRWWWKTYTAWCAEGRCSRPVLALKSRRAGRRTSPNTVTPWRVWVSPDPTRDRAVVKAGIRGGSRWSITSRTRRVATGPTDNVWVAGHIGITHTPDGQDWLSWNNDRAQIRISKASNGRRLSGPVVAQGSTPQVRNIGGRWVLLWYWQTDDEDIDNPVNITSAPTIAGLRTSQRTQLERHATDFILKLFGPEEGPLFALWWSSEKAHRTQSIRGAWIDSAGTVSAPKGLDAEHTLTAVRSLPAPSGGLVLCPWSLAAPLGGVFQPQPDACDMTDIRPVRLR